VPDVDDKSYVVSNSIRYFSSSYCLFFLFLLFLDLTHERTGHLAPSALEVGAIAAD
jgi:hypothetical protein